MSGRLTIMRHKSWNVWSRENMAKVEADEAAEKARVDAEETAKRLGLPPAGTEVETPRQGRSSGGGGGGGGGGSGGDRKRGREERTREDGVPLGQGATERMGDQPFYLQVPVHRHRPQVEGEGGIVKHQEGGAGADTATATADTAVAIHVRGRVLHGAQAAAARARDDRRKTIQDPTRAFMPATDQDQDQAWGGNDAPFDGSREGAGPSPAPSFAGARARARALALELTARPSASAPVEEEAEAPWDMDALRERRLRRELRERRRAALLFRE